MTAKFKKGDLVRLKAVKGMPQYCEPGTILRVTNTARNMFVSTGDGAYICDIVFGTWTDDYDHWPFSEEAVFYAGELEALHDGKIQGR